MARKVDKAEIYPQGWELVRGIKVVVAKIRDFTNLTHI